MVIILYMEFKDIKVEKSQRKQTIYLYLKSLGYSENYLKNLRKEYGYIKKNGNICFMNEYISDGDIISVYTVEKPLSPVLLTIQ